MRLVPFILPEKTTCWRVFYLRQANRQGLRRTASRLSGPERLPEHIKRLGADYGFIISDKEGRHACHAAAGGIFLCRFEMRQILPAFDRRDHCLGIEARVAGYLRENVKVSDVQAMRKVGGEKAGMKLRELPVLP